MNVMADNQENKKSLSELADELEQRMSDELDLMISKSALYRMADGKLGATLSEPLHKQHPGKVFLMGDDPRLPAMPAKPTLMDFMKYRSRGNNHLLQSGLHALNAGMSEATITACLLHDIA